MQHLEQRALLALALAHLMDVAQVGQDADEVAALEVVRPRPGFTSLTVS